MRVPLTDEAGFEIDLELPTECWDREEIEDEEANLYRLCYMAGYVKATKDAKSGKIGNLISRVAKVQQRTRV